MDKYTWVDYGSSYLPSDLNAAYLWAQLEKADEINANRLQSWNRYNEAFKKLEEEGKLELPTIPDECVHNAHMYYVKLKDLDERTDFLSYMRENDIYSVFHYIPLHSAPAGIKFGEFRGKDQYTTLESERLARLPMYYGVSEEDLSYVIKKVIDYFNI